MSDSDELKSFIELLLSEGEPADRERAKTDLQGWLEAYAERITSEKDLWSGDDERQEAAKSAKRFQKFGFPSSLMEHLTTRVLKR